MSRILVDHCDVAQLISKEELLKRFEQPNEKNAFVADGSIGWQKRQRSFLTQAVTACLASSAQDQSRDALVRLLGSIVRDNLDGFDAGLVEEADALLKVVQLPDFMLGRGEVDLLEKSLRSIADTEVLGNLLHRFPQHGSALLEKAEARLVEYKAALAWLDDAISIPERLVPKTTGELLEHIDSARRAFDNYVEKPAYRDLLKASMPLYQQCELAMTQVLETLYRRALAEWWALACAFVSDQPASVARYRVHDRSNMRWTVGFAECDKIQARALGEALASVPMLDISGSDAFVAKLRMISKWLGHMESGALASLLENSQVAIDVLRDLSTLTESMSELLADLLPEDAQAVDELLFKSLASRLSVRLLKQVEMPMKKMLEMHAASKGLVAVYSVSHRTEELMSVIEKVSAQALLISAEERSLEEGLAEQFAGKRNQQRSQFLIRYGKLGAAAARLLELKGENKKILISEASGLALVAMVKAQDAFKIWADAVAPEFAQIGSGWDVAIDISGDVASMRAFADSIVAWLVRCWTTQVQAQGASIEVLCLSQGLLHSSRMMVDEPLRQSLADSAKSLHTSGLLNVAGDQLKVLKQFEGDVAALSKLPGKSPLVRLRRFGRAMIAIHWAVDELCSFTASSAADLLSEADKVEDRLKQKGFKMSSGLEGDIPSYIWSTIRRMRTEAAKLAAAAEAGSAGSSQHEGVEGGAAEH